MDQRSAANKQPQTPQRPAAMGFRYACQPNGNNTGLSHYILMDKKT
jgi:modified peptide precursor CbpA